MEQRLSHCLLLLGFSLPQTTSHKFEREHTKDPRFIDGRRGKGGGGKVKGGSGGCFDFTAELINSIELHKSLGTKPSLRRSFHRTFVEHLHATFPWQLSHFLHQPLLHLQSTKIP